MTGAPPRDQQPLGPDRDGLAPGGAHACAYAAVEDLGVQEPGAGPDVDAAFLQTAGQMTAHVGVLQRDDPVGGLDQGDLRAQGTVERGVLHADRAAPEHQHGRREPGREEGVVARHHTPAVRLEPRERARA